MFVFLVSCATPPSERGETLVDHQADTAPAERTDYPRTVAPEEDADPLEETVEGDRDALEEVEYPLIALAGPPRDEVVPERPLRPHREVVIDQVIAGMSLEERVGQLFMPAIIANSRGVPRLTVDDEVRHLLATVRPGGLILFGANLRDPEQTRTLVRELQEASPYPLIIAVDQEGGVVSRLTSSELMPATVVPSARRVGLAGDDDLAYRVAHATGRELRALGITMNFAPVADILTNPANPVIGSRAFGSEPELVSRMVAATVRGLQDAGVSAVVKHFPGHGDTSRDTHLQTVIVPHTLERLRAVEFAPFLSGFAAGADGVMTAHISLPNVIGDHTPSTLSPMVLKDLLRGEFGYEGLIVTDSLIMGALSTGEMFRDITEDHLPLHAFRAGADILLYPPRPEAGFQKLLHAVREGEIAEEDIDMAVRRILRVKFDRGLMHAPLAGDIASFLRTERYYPEELELGMPEHRELMEEVYRRSR